jgi:hypothetical protein
MQRKGIELQSNPLSLRPTDSRFEHKLEFITRQSELQRSPGPREAAVVIDIPPSLMLTMWP